jgi:hypothetical protein
LEGICEHSTATAGGQEERASSEHLSCGAAALLVGDSGQVSKVCCTSSSLLLWLSCSVDNTAHVWGE